MTMESRFTKAYFLCTDKAKIDDQMYILCLKNEIILNVRKKNWYNDIHFFGHNKFLKLKIVGSKIRNSTNYDIKK